MQSDMASQQHGHTASGLEVAGPCAAGPQWTARSMAIEFCPTQCMGLVSSRLAVCMLGRASDRAVLEVAHTPALQQFIAAVHSYATD